MPHQTFLWEKGGGRDRVLNFIRTYNHGGPNGYPKLNIWINDREKEYLENKLSENIALWKNYEVDGEERQEKKDCDILLDAIDRSNRIYKKKVLENERW